MLISNEQIEIAEQKGACEEALSWLRKKSRSWQELAEKEYEWFYWEGCNTKLCPSEILEELSKHSDPYIRSLVARHPNSLPKTLTILAKDKDSYVREGVAINKHTPLNILQILSKDSDESVKEFLALNPSISTEILSYLVDNGGIKTRVYITYQKNLPEELIIKLAKDVSERVRKSLVRCVPLPIMWQFISK